MAKQWEGGVPGNLEATLPMCLHRLRLIANISYFILKYFVLEILIFMADDIYHSLSVIDIVNDINCSLSEQFMSFTCNIRGSH